MIIPGHTTAKNKTIALSRKTHEKVWEIDKAGVMAITDHRLFIIDYNGYTPMINAITLNK